MMSLELRLKCNELNNFRSFFSIKIIEFSTIDEILVKLDKSLKQFNINSAEILGDSECA